MRSAATPVGIGLAPWTPLTGFRRQESGRKSLTVALSDQRLQDNRRRSSRSLKICGKLQSLRSSSFTPSTTSTKLWTAKHPPILSIKFQQHRRSVVISATMVSQEPPTAFLQEEMPMHPDLLVGELDNGLRYVILPNKMPPNRFEAHLEVHAGSVDEESNQQGLAHLVEHVTFLGSAKRESLLGTGSRSNAYTDFHHTVFHVHCPLTNTATKKPMMPQVLDALKDIAFNPQFSSTRIEKERRAVMSEAQMMNTIDYRVSCQMLKFLHQENALGSRFPIGKMDQVQKWDRDTIKRFWRKWYYPGNMTLYIVGVLPDGIEATKKLINDAFGEVNINMYESIDDEDQTSNDNGTSTAQVQLGEEKKRQSLRPPVEHTMGIPETADREAFPCPISIYRHPLLQQLTLSIFCKLPTRKVQKYADLKYTIMLRILTSIFAHRMQERQTRDNAPFASVELDISDSAREGCCVGTINVTSEPGDWKSSTQLAIEEIRRLQRHGVQKSELERYLDAFIMDAELAKEAMDSVESVDNLEYLMEFLALDHKIIHPDTNHEAVNRIAKTITVNEMKALTKSTLSFGSDYGHEKKLLEAYDSSDKSEWAEPGPSFATSILACVPEFVDASGGSVGAYKPRSRAGQNMVTIDHVEVDTSAEELPLLEETEEEFVPENAIRFEISEGEIRDVLMEQSSEVEAYPEIDVPERLIPEERLQQLIEERKPRFVPLERGSKEDPTIFVDPHSNVVFRRLSNGIRLNFYSTDIERKIMLIRVTMPGGSLQNDLEVGPSGYGAVQVGVASLSKSTRLGEWTQAQVQLYCISRLVESSVDATDEFLVTNMSLPVLNNAPEAALELLHLSMEHPHWDEATISLAKQGVISKFKTDEKSLEDASELRLAAAMVGDDHRLVNPTPSEVEALTLEGTRNIILQMLNTENMEVTFVGDFDLDNMQEAALKYLGTLQRPVLKPDYIKEEKRVNFCKDLGAERHQQWHLEDSDERAVGYICGPAPSYWGPFGSKVWPPKKPGKVVPPTSDPEGPKTHALGLALTKSIRRAHPLYPSVTMALLKEVINSRLFTTVRDQLGLTYDATFKLEQLERHPNAWFKVQLTSSPDKIHETVKASILVLQRFATQKITMHELLRAKRTMLTKHESDLQKNVHWIDLLTHLQCDQVPLKTVEVLRDFKQMLISVSIDDLYDAYNHMDFDVDNLYTCIGTSGKEPLLEKDLDDYLPKTKELNEKASTENQVKESNALWKALVTALSNTAAQKQK